MSKLKNQQSGFTIIELILALVFFSFILIFATASYILINRSFVRGANVKLVQEEGRRIMTEISSALRDAGDDTIFVFDNDNSFADWDAGHSPQILCNPTNTDLNLSGSVNCRRRLCIGDLRFSWNENIMNSNSERPITPTGRSSEPFHIVKSGGAGSSVANCQSDVDQDEAIELIDKNGVMIQDLDIQQSLFGVSWRIRLIVSSVNDIDYSDGQDLNYDASNGLRDNNVILPKGGSELRAENCVPDNVSLAFCHVEELTSVVNIR